MRVALDTNVLVYAHGVNGSEKKQAARELFLSLPHDSIVLPVQALNELFNVLVVKAKRSAIDVRDAILGWHDAYNVFDTSADVMTGAIHLAADHQLRIWDAVMMCAAAEAKCRLLLSEDLQDGFTWHGVTVANPFAAKKHPLLEALLRQSEATS